MEGKSTARSAVVVLVTVCFYACGGGGGAGDGGAARPPIADLTGTWSVTESGVSNCPGAATYTLDPFQIAITQSGNRLAVVAPAGNFDGTIDGDRASWTGTYPSGSGRTTISAMALTVASDGNAFSGSADWTWTDGASACSGTSQSINATRVPAAAPVPAAPTGLSGSAPSASAVHLVWNDNAGDEGGYKVERRRSGEPDSAFGQIALAPADATSYDDTGLNAQTAYDYRVRAYNAAGNSAYSNIFTVTTLAPPVPAPLPPSGLRLTVTSPTEITLRWNDNSANETAFHIERSTNAHGGFSEIATPGADATSYQDTGLNSATRYYYRVRASNATGSSAYSNTDDAVTFPAVVAPAAPSDLDANAAVLTLRIDLSWTDNADNETGFKIERSRNANDDFTQIATTPANVTAFADTSDLRGNTRYHYRVRATGATGLDSDFSNTASARTTRLAGDMTMTMTRIEPRRTRGAAAGRRAGRRCG